MFMSNFAMSRLHPAAVIYHISSPCTSQTHDDILPAYTYARCCCCCCSWRRRW